MTILGAGGCCGGAEIALKLARTRRTWLAGRDTGRIPIALGGSLFRLMNSLLTADISLGRRFAVQSSGKGSPLVRCDPETHRRRHQATARVTGIAGGSPMLEDGRVLEIENVVWCTGFARDNRWIRLPFGPGAEPVHRRGVVDTEPGLSCIGLPYQHSLASSFWSEAGRRN